MTTDDPFDYLSNGTSNQIKQKIIFGSKWLVGFSKMGHLIKLNKQKNILGQDGNWVSNKIGQTKMTSYLCTIIVTFLGTYIGRSSGYLGK